ncbi:hypothetical protein COLO4_07200 [Corchorus olitorius]|uniref:Uncharacterized protein n=1 Tax=Corchorus olitorius TaxID=93759 RepID=A0A1R3KKI7_9ROSI|nr:hypothetical protein COLO4_07200 [Corchorus olitorius]
MATYSKNKAVVVTVYVERQRRKLSANHRNRHQHYFHHTIKQESVQHKHGGGAAGKGYNRRAELLHYSRRLRESARLEKLPKPLESEPVSSTDQPPSNNVSYSALLYII